MAVTTERLRVGYLINSMRTGGAERIVADIVRHLDREAFEPSVICLYDRGPLADEVEAHGVRVRTAGLSRRVKPGGWVRVWRALGGLELDVVHTHLPEAAWFGLPAARVHGVPVRLAHLHNCYWNWSPKVRRLDRATSAHATLTLACSRAAYRFARDELGYDEERLELVPNSIDTARFEDGPSRDAARRALGLADTDLVLLCVAELTEQKGHRHLIDAMPAIVREVPHARLLLAGGGDSAPLREQAERLGVDQRIDFLGRRDDVPALMAAADLFVIASLWEGLPLVVAEAGAAGLPVVATAVDGLAEVVEDGDTGLLVPPRDPARLADAVCLLAADPERRRQMGERARSLIRATRDVRATVSRLENLYRDHSDRATTRTEARVAG